MMAFLDTEFTGLEREPQLLSVGIVVGTDVRCEFYAEVTDTARIQEACRFVREAVLPQFGKIDGAACSYAELGCRLASFLTSLSHSLTAGERIEVAFESDRDWELIERAIQDAGASSWASLLGALHPVNVYNMAGFAAGAVAASAYFKAQQRAPFSRHHALCDARALRLAFDTAQASRANATVGRSPRLRPVTPEANPGQPSQTA